MKFARRLFHSPFLIRLLHWEYWPFGIVQMPAFFYWLWLSARARSFFFFTASNPGIEMGGMFGESKYQILDKIPRQYVPSSILVRFPAQPASVVASMKSAGLSFPVIVKPDKGERGWKVVRVDDADSLESYMVAMKMDFIVQEYLDFPLEFGVLYRQMPGDLEGHVTSVVLKEMLTVTGDGTSTLRQLIFSFDRARLQWRRLKKKYATHLQTVLEKGKRMELESIGNHRLGTKFVDAGYLINDELSRSFTHISSCIEGFYFGRYDLRCATTEDLFTGNVKIMELNGCGTEPGHIYHPGTSIWKAMRTLLAHWNSIFLISAENHRRGVAYISFRTGLRIFREFRKTVGKD